MVPRVPELYPQPPGIRQRGVPKNTLKNPSKNRRGDWGHHLRGGKGEVSIRIMYQNIGGMNNASYQSIQHKLYTFKNTMIN